MLLSVNPADIIREIGHDGTDIIWSEYSDSRKYRGHSIAELQDVCFRRGRMLAPVFVNPVIAPDYDAKPIAVYGKPWQRVRNYLKQDALIMGSIANIGHSVAYCAGEDCFYDPRGYKTMHDNLALSISEIYLLCRI